MSQSISIMSSPWSSEGAIFTKQDGSKKAVRWIRHCWIRIGTLE